MTCSISFIGERLLDRVRFELVLLKLAHKRRKESSGPAEQVTMGSGEVVANPSEDHPPSKAPAVSVPADAFGVEGPNAGHHSSALLIRVCPMPQVS